MEESLRAILEEQRQWLHTQINDQNQEIVDQRQQILEQQHKQIQDQQQRLDDQHQEMLNQIISKLEEQPRVIDPQSYRNLEQRLNGRNFQFNPKVEFLCFEGHDPKGWIKKCTRYFGLCRIPDDQRVDLASLHLKGAVEVWFSCYMIGRRGLHGKNLLLICMLDLKTVWGVRL